MIIEEKDFKIEEGSTLARYNLYLRKIINKGKDNEREDWDIEGYDMSMPAIFNKLSHILTDRKLDKCSLKQYMRQYKESINELSLLIKDL